MNNVDKITRDAKILFDFTKDSLTKKLVLASSDLGLTELQLGALTRLIEITVEESYQKSIPNYQNAIKKHL